MILTSYYPRKARVQNAKKASDLWKHGSGRSRILVFSDAEKAGMRPCRGLEYVSDLRIYHEVELRGFEPRTSCMP
jgi:hypothetical protein